VPDPVSTLNASIEDRRIVVLTWPASSRATRYDLYWSPVAGVDPQTAQRIANVTSPFSHTEVDGGLPYHYIITATNATGTSAPSGEVTVTVPPSAIQGLSLTAGDSVVDLTWSGATGATHYLVYWSNDPDTVLSSGQVIRVEVPALTHSGLQNSATYHYRVSAVGAGGEGPVSAQLAGQPETPVPGAPGAFSIAIHPDDSRSAILSWEAPEQPLRPEDILLYNVYRFSSTEAATLVAQTYAGLFIDTPPVAGVPWSYRVSAVTVAGSASRPHRARTTTRATPQVSRRAYSIAVSLQNAGPRKDDGAASSRQETEGRRIQGAAPCAYRFSHASIDARQRSVMPRFICSRTGLSK
jgi:hypothetical protein